MRLVYFISAVSLYSSQQFSTSSSQAFAEKAIDNTSLPQKNFTNEIDSTAAKTWLTEAIIQFFDGTNSDMQKLTTATYYEFKMDAMNVELEIDGSLSEEEFRKKWQHKYDLNIHPTQTGFLISGQDWGNIKVAQITVKSVNSTDRSITFRTLIRDEKFNIDYDRDIIVVKNEGRYLISDVLEYD